MHDLHGRPRHEEKEAGRDDREHRVLRVDVPNLPGVHGRRDGLDQDLGRGVARIGRLTQVGAEQASPGEVFLHHQAHGRLVGPDELDVPVDECAQGVLEGGGLAQRRTERGHEPLHRVGEHLLVQRPLVLEVVVQHRLVDVGGVGDGLHPSPVPALPGKHVERRVEDLPLRLGVLGRKGGRGRHRERIWGRSNCCNRGPTAWFNQMVNCRVKRGAPSAGRGGPGAT